MLKRVRIRQVRRLRIVNRHLAEYPYPATLPQKTAAIECVGRPSCSGSTRLRWQVAAGPCSACLLPSSVWAFVSGSWHRWLADGRQPDNLNLSAAGLRTRCLAGQQFQPPRSPATWKPLAAPAIQRPRAIRDFSNASAAVAGLRMSAALRQALQVTDNPEPARKDDAGRRPDQHELLATHAASNPGFRQQLLTHRGYAGHLFDRRRRQHLYPLPRVSDFAGNVKKPESPLTATGLGKV